MTIPRPDSPEMIDLFKREMSAFDSLPKHVRDEYNYANIGPNPNDIILTALMGGHHEVANVPPGERFWEDESDV